MDEAKSVMSGEAAPVSTGNVGAPDVVRTGEALAQLVLYASGRPELAALVPVFAGVARGFEAHFRGRGIDPGPFPALMADIDRITADGLAADGAFRRRQRVR